MNAYIDRHGTLHVESEVGNGLEDYALRKWYENWPGSSAFHVGLTSNHDPVAVEAKIVRHPNESSGSHHD